jgi:hypothetical protein
LNVFLLREISVKPINLKSKPVTMKIVICKTFFLIFFLVANLLSYGQEGDGKNVHLKVIKNDKTILDTSFVTDEKTNNEILKNKIKELTGLDIKMFTSYDLIADKKMEHEYSGSYTYAVTDEDKIDIKTRIKRIHVDTEQEGDKLYVYINETDNKNDTIWIGKDKDIDIEILEDDDTLKVSKYIMSIKSGDEKDVKVLKKGDDKFIIIGEEGVKKIGKDEKGEHIIIKKKGENFLIISEDDTLSHNKVHIIKGDKKKSYFIIKKHKGEWEEYILKEDEFVTDEGEKIKVIVENDEDGTIIDKQINIIREKEGEEGKEIEVVFEIKEGNKKKEEKEKKFEKDIKKEKE